MGRLLITEILCTKALLKFTEQPHNNKVENTRKRLKNLWLFIHAAVECGFVDQLFRKQLTNVTTVARGNQGIKRFFDPICKVQSIVRVYSL